MFGVLLFAFLVLVLGFVLYRLATSRSKEEIFRIDESVPDRLPFKRNPEFLGDELADAFLEKHGPTHVYNAKDIADELGLRNANLPLWLQDKARLVKEGQLFQQTWCLEIMSSGLGAIVESYGFAPGNKILQETGRLLHNADRRLFETGNFSLSAIEHGLESDSPALDVIARVRLLHAMVRKHIRGLGESAWKSDWDVPVHQEDSLHTLFMSSHVTLKSMEAMGLRISEREREAMSAFWAKVGFFLGIDEEFLPRSYKHEVELYSILRKRKFRHDDLSKALANASIVASAGLAPLYLSVEMTRARAWSSLGPETAEKMGISEPGMYYKIGLALIWTFTTLKQGYHSLIGLDPAKKCEMVRQLLDDQLKAGGPCKYRFSKVKG